LDLDAKGNRLHLYFNFELEINRLHIDLKITKIEHDVEVGELYLKCEAWCWKLNLCCKLTIFYNTNPNIQVIEEIGGDTLVQNILDHKPIIDDDIKSL
jgi:hypothetical protein